MATAIYGVLLVISIFVIVYMAQKNYENIDIYCWTIVVLVPLIVLGYWLKTTVTTPEAAYMLFCYIYLDSTVLITVMLFSLLRFMGIPVKPFIKLIAYGLAFAHMFMIWMSAHNGLYYADIQLVDTGYGIATKMTYGPLRGYHWIYLTAILLSIAILIVIAIIRRGTHSRRTIIFYTAVVVAGLLTYLLETLIRVDFTILPVIYVASDVLLAIGYDHEHTHDISCLISEQQKYHGARGYAAVDLKGRYLSCNPKTYDFLPELALQIVDARLVSGMQYTEVFYELIERFKKGEGNTLDFMSGEIACQCEIAEFSIRKDGKIQGYIFDIRDITEEKKVLDVMQHYNETLNAEVTQKTEYIKGIQERVVIGLANMVENRDNNTGGHVKRTSDVIKYIVKEVENQRIYDIKEPFATDVIRAAPMHDLGKITIENAILNKPGKLTDEEYEIMKTHSVKSGEFVNIILKDVEEQHFVDVAFNVARYHHERWDGKGYPDGLVGEMIPLEARIMAVADVYDALVSERVYKDSMPFDQAAKIMLEGMGSQFDPNMATVFKGCRAELEAYYSKHNSKYS